MTAVISFTNMEKSQGFVLVGVSFKNAPLNEELLHQDIFSASVGRFDVSLLILKKATTCNDTSDNL